MATGDVNPVELMLQVIRENVPRDIWRESPLIEYRRIGIRIVVRWENSSYESICPRVALTRVTGTVRRQPT